MVNAVLCLKRLQSRSDARRGTKHGVGCDDAVAVLALPVCVCVCTSWKKGSSLGAGDPCGAGAGTGAWDLHHGLGRGCSNAAGRAELRLVCAETVRVRLGAGGGLGVGSSLLIAEPMPMRGWREADTFWKRSSWRSSAGFHKTQAGAWNQAERPLAPADLGCQGLGAVSSRPCGTSPGCKEGGCHLHGGA